MFNLYLSNIVSGVWYLVSSNIHNINVFLLGVLGRIPKGGRARDHRHRNGKVLINYIVGLLVGGEVGWDVGTGVGCGVGFIVVLLESRTPFHVIYEIEIEICRTKLCTPEHHH